MVAFQIPFFAIVCFSLSVLLLLVINFIPDDFLAQSGLFVLTESFKVSFFFDRRNE
jgi:hypothetical protein